MWEVQYRVSGLLNHSWHEFLIFLFVWMYNRCRCRCSCSILNVALYLLVIYATSIRALSLECYLHKRQIISLTIVSFIFRLPFYIVYFFFFISQQMLNLCYIYYLSKLTEFADTVFFVLRKKSSQITWLHVYHHSVTPLETWVLVKFLAGKFARLIHLVLFLSNT